MANLRRQQIEQLRSLSRADRDSLRNEIEAMTGENIGISRLNATIKSVLGERGVGDLGVALDGVARSSGERIAPDQKKSFKSVPVEDLSRKNQFKRKLQSLQQKIDNEVDPDAIEKLEAKMDRIKELQGDEGGEERSFLESLVRADPLRSQVGRGLEFFDQLFNNDTQEPTPPTQEAQVIKKQASEAGVDPELAEQGSDAILRNLAFEQLIDSGIENPSESQVKRAMFLLKKSISIS